MDQDISIKKKTIRNRSAAYPAISLSEAIDYSQKLITAYPKSEFDRISAASSMGYTRLSGTSAPKVAALVHYGLLDRNGSQYKNSELADRILRYSSEDEREKAILEAVKHPKLFEALIGEYTGSAIPTTLNNILVRNYKINPKVSDTVVKIFKESIEFAGLYSNGIVSEHTSQRIEELKNNEDNNKSKATNYPERNAISASRQTFTGMIDVELPCGIVLSYTADIAYLFATGKFGGEIEALNKAVTDAKLQDVNKDELNDIYAASE